MRGIIVTGIVEREGNQFVSLCPELDVASCGDTAEEALDMLEDALQVYIEDLLDIGNLDKVFLERGVNIRTDIPGKGEKVLVSALPGKNLQSLRHEDSRSCCGISSVLEWHDFLFVLVGKSSALW